MCKNEPSANGPQPSCPSLPSALTKSLVSRQAEHETGIPRVSTDDLSRQRFIRWRSAYPTDGKAFIHFSGVFSHTQQEIMGTFRSFLS